MSRGLGIPRLLALRACWPWSRRSGGGGTRRQVGVREMGSAVSRGSRVPQLAGSSTWWFAGNSASPSCPRNRQRPRSRRRRHRPRQPRRQRPAGIPSRTRRLHFPDTQRRATARNKPMSSANQTTPTLTISGQPARPRVCRTPAALQVRKNMPLVGRASAQPRPFRGRGHSFPLLGFLLACCAVRQYCSVST